MAGDQTAVTKPVAEHVAGVRHSTAGMGAHGSKGGRQYPYSMYLRQTDHNHQDIGLNSAFVFLKTSNPFLYLISLIKLRFQEIINGFPVFISERLLCGDRNEICRLLGIKDRFVFY